MVQRGALALGTRLPFEKPRVSRRAFQIRQARRVQERAKRIAKLEAGKKAKQKAKQQAIDAEIERARNLSPEIVKKLKKLGILRSGEDVKPAIQHLRKMGFSDRGINIVFEKYASPKVYGRPSYKPTMRTWEQQRRSRFKWTGVVKKTSKGKQLEKIIFQRGRKITTSRQTKSRLLKEGYGKKDASVIAKSISLDPKTKKLIYSISSQEAAKLSAKAQAKLGPRVIKAAREYKEFKARPDVKGREFFDKMKMSKLQSIAEQDKSLYKKTLEFVDKEIERLEKASKEKPKKTEDKGLYKIKFVKKYKEKIVDKVGGRLREYGLVAGTSALGFIRGILGIPEIVSGIARGKITANMIKESLIESGKGYVALIKTKPDVAVVKIGTEILVMQGTGKALSSFGKISKAGYSNVISKLGGAKYFNKLKTGSKVKIPVGGGKFATLNVVNRIPTETLKSQIQRAGKVQTAISSQADKLVGLIKRKRVVRKPMPNENKLDLNTRNLLARFDRGTITRRELFRLNDSIRRQRGKGLLERAFFADPTGKIRPSRLGILKDAEAGIMDYIRGKITFKKAKPQLLLFDDIKIAKFPKNLKEIARKIKTGKALTKLEGDKLLAWQLKKSGKFKPLGFVSRESEISLAPGEIIKRGKVVARIKIKGEVIPIIKASVWKPSKNIKTLITKWKKGKLTKTQERKLDRLLRKKTGFDYGLSSSKKIAKKYVPIKRIGASLLPRLRVSQRKSISKITKRKLPISRRVTSRRRVSLKKVSRKVVSRRRPSSRKVSKPTSRPRSPKKKVRAISRKGIYRPYRRKVARGISRPIPRRRPTKRITRPVKIIAMRPRIRKRKVKKKGPGYFILEKRGKKFVKLKGSPLSFKDAKDRLAFRLDNKISRTAKLIKAKGRRLGKIKPKERGYFGRYGKNLRNYKIRRGRKIRTPLTFIEKKGKAVISTLGEKRQLALNRRLKSLKKARSVRAKNIKRRKTKK